MNRIVPTVALIAAALLCSVATAQESPPPGNPCTPWPATDALGRMLPMPEEVGPPRADRFVGMFYFLWHNQRQGKCPNWDGPYDIAKILARDPDALKKPDSPLWPAGDQLLCQSTTYADSGLRKSNQRKNGPPSRAVMMPTGNSVGAMMVRATVSQSTRNAPPNNNVAGIK